MANNVVGSNLKTPKKLTLKELAASSQNEQTTIQDLVPNIEASPTVVNTPSNYNRAAYAAMLDSSNNMLDSFRSVLSEGEQTGSSPTAQTIVSQVANQAHQGYADGLGGVLTDSSISDDQKREAINQVYNKDSSLYSPSNLLSMKALDTPASTDKTTEGSDLRYQVGDYMQGIIQENNTKQAVYNSVKTQLDPNLLSKAYNFVSSILPGVTQVRQAKIMSSIGQGSFTKNLVKAFTHFGSNEKLLTTYLDSIPSDQAMLAASNIADVLTDHSNPVIFTPNDEVRREALDRVLSGDGYSTTQNVIDTVTSWADASIIGGPMVKGLFKAGKGLKAADITENAFKAAESQAKDTSSVIDPVATSIESKPPVYTKTNKNSYGQFLRSREQTFYDSSNGVPYVKSKETKLSSAIRDALRSDVQPVSVFENIKNVNPNMAQAMYDDMTTDATGQVSKAVAGTERSDALANPAMPEIGHEDGSVAYKVSYPDALQQIREMLPAEVVDFFKHDGMTRLQQGEKAAARAWKVNQFEEAIGMTPRQEMFQLLPDYTKYVENPQGFSWKGVYGPQSSGFSNAEDALETAKIALRNTGIDESNLGLLRKSGGNYVPTTLDELKQFEANGMKVPKDFLVTVDHDYRIENIDIDKAQEALSDARIWSKLSVKRNWTDLKMVSSGQSGKISNYLFDFGSQLHGSVYKDALQAADKSVNVEKGLLKQVDQFAQGWKKLPRDKQSLLMEEIQEANVKSRDYDYTSLTAKGFSAEDMDVLKNFKQVQDVHWYLRNHILTKQLNKAGYEEYVHSGSLTNLPAKRVSRGSVPGDVRYYEPNSGSIMVKPSNEVDDLYKNGGGVARLRQPIIMSSGETVEHVLHTSSATDGYLRSFTSNSKVLNYRPGYYQVRYKDPWFIVEKVNGGNKSTNGYDHAVSTARDMNEAKTVTNRLNAQGGDHYFRPSRELLSDEVDAADVDLSIAEGMSAFRRRGKMLQEGSSPITSVGMTHIQNPVESIVGNVLSLSRKIVMDDVIDAIKRRAVNYYSDLLPKNKYGEPLVPKDLRDVRYRGGMDYNPENIKDARGIFAYANMLENSYVNLLDDGVKSALNTVADVFGQHGLVAGEKAARVMSEKSITRGAKSTVYHAFLGLAPFRQLLIQGQQAVLTAALNPAWVASKGAFGQPVYLALRTMGLDATNPLVRQVANVAWGADSERVFKQFQRTGLTAAIDHQTFVSGAVNDMAKNMIANSRQGITNNILKVPRAISTWSRKIGFDAGEFYSNTMTWAAHRDLYARRGLDVFSDDVADQVAGAARNYTGAMNFAGDLPTNKNALSLIFQFTQNSQKMFLNAWTNRAIEPSVRNRLKVLSVALYGAPTALFVNYLGSVQDPDARDVLYQGIEGWGINKMLSLMSGQKSEIDWSSLSPFNAYGTLDMIHNLWTDGFGESVANAPSSSLLFGSNPRVTDAFKSLARYFHISNDYGNPQEFLDVVNDFAKISSGYSALLKAKVLFETNKKISSSGGITDDHLDKVNAIGVAFGFPTTKEGINYYLQNMNSQTYKERVNEVKEFYKQAKQAYTSDLLNDNELSYTQKVINMFHLGFGDDDFARQELTKLINNDLKQGDARLFNQALQNCPLYNRGDCLKLIDATPFKDEQAKSDAKALIIAGNLYKPED